MIEQVAVQLFLEIGPVVIAAVVAFLMLRRSTLESVEPFTERTLRPPGESCRLKLEELDEKLWIRFSVMLSVPVVMALAWAFLRQSSIYLTPEIIFTTSTLWSLATLPFLLRVIRDRRNYSLGFRGERYVGQVLTELLKKGFEVFHDVPFEKFNIDHVAVGPSGVYCLETKTRRKPVDGKSGKKTSYTVTFDGESLEWPWGCDRYGVDQARTNAGVISDLLSKALAAPVVAKPVLVLPGWNVKRLSKNGGVSVINPKEIFGLVSGNGHAKLDHKTITQISNQLRQKCEIVG